MNLHLTIGPLAALIAGILILIAPKLLNYIVAAISDPGRRGGIVR